MCNSMVVMALADLFEVLGIIAMIVGFFSYMTEPRRPNKWSAGVFLLGIIAFIVGTRILGAC